MNGVNETALIKDSQGYIEEIHQLRLENYRYRDLLTAIYDYCHYCSYFGNQACAKCHPRHSKWKFDKTKFFKIIEGGKETLNRNVLSIQEDRDHWKSIAFAFELSLTSGILCNLCIHRAVYEGDEPCSDCYNNNGFRRFEFNYGYDENCEIGVSDIAKESALKLQSAFKMDYSEDTPNIDEITDEYLNMLLDNLTDGLPENTERKEISGDVINEM